MGTIDEYRRTNQRKEDARRGHDFAKGVVQYFCELMIFLVILLVAVSIIRNSFNLFTDDSDKNGWNRSGMKIYTDYKTGTEYLSVGNNLVKRDLK